MEGIVTFDIPGFPDFNDPSYAVHTPANALSTMFS